MPSKLIVFIAQVKYPSANASYLTAQAYWFTNYEEFERARDDFISNCEKDDFKILNFLVYNPHLATILSMGLWALVFNRVQKPPKPVRCDAGASR